MKEEEEEKIREFYERRGFKKKTIDELIAIIKRKETMIYE